MPARGACFSVIGLALVLVGCAHIPGVPAGPARPGLSIGVTYAYAHGSAKTLSNDLSGRPYGVTANSQMHLAPFPLIPLRAMARYSPASIVDFGADVGMLNVGLQLRAGQLGAERKMPWGFELEWRTGQLTAFENSVAEQARMYRGRLEAYPRLATTGDTSVFGLLSLGASTGKWVHYIQTPDLSQGDGFPGPALEALRSETRLEASLGIHIRESAGGLTLAVMPWLTLDHGRAQQDCVECALELLDLDADWGFAVVLSGSLALSRD